MPRWMFFAPLMALIAASAVVGLSLGRKAARSSETEVIAQIAARHARETGGQASDCAARPATSAELWLVVSCVSKGGAGRVYFIDHFGAVEHGAPLP